MLKKDSPTLRGIRYKVAGFVEEKGKKQTKNKIKC